MATLKLFHVQDIFDNYVSQFFKFYIQPTLVISNSDIIVPSYIKEYSFDTFGLDKLEVVASLI